MSPALAGEFLTTAPPGKPKGSFFFFFLKYLFIYLWLCWVFVSARGLSVVVASGGHSSSRCAGLSPSRPLLLWSTDSRRTGSVVVAHGSSCSAVCGIFPDQGSNPCPLHWQADSQPLRHQGSPGSFFKTSSVCYKRWLRTSLFALTPAWKKVKSISCLGFSIALLLVWSITQKLSCQLDMRFLP